MDPNDPEFVQITASLQACSTYSLERLNKIHEFALDDYPDRFLALFDSVPFVDPTQVASVRDAALSFVPAMNELRERFQLSNPEPWLAAAEAHRRTH